MPKYSAVQRLALQHANRTKLSGEIIGLLVIFYGLWMHNFAYIWGGLGIGILVGIWVWRKERKKQYKKLSRFELFWLGHLYPINLIAHLIGYAVFVYGAWMQSIGMILLGSILILCGDIYAKFKQRRIL